MFKAIYAMFVLSVASTAVAAEPSSSVLPFDAVRLQRSLAFREAPRFSPDGTKISYTLCDPRNRTGVAANDGCSVHVIEVATQHSVWKSAIGRNAWGPVWSPSGKSLAFVMHDGNEVPHVFVMSAGTDPRDLGIADTFRAFHWIDERTLLTSVPHVREKRDAQAPNPYRSVSTIANSTATVYRSPADIPASERDNALAPGSFRMPDLSADIVSINVTDGSRKILVRDVALALPDSLALAPDHKILAYTTYGGFAPNSSQIILSNVFLVPVTGNGPVQSISNSAAVIGLSWSPDGRCIAWFQRTSLRQTSLTLYDRDSGKTLTIDPSRTGESFMLPPLGLQPVWLDDQTIAAPIADASAVHDVGRKATPTRLALVDVRRGELKKVATPQPLTIDGITIARDDVLLLGEEIRAHTSSLYRLDRQAERLHIRSSESANISSMSVSGDGETLLFVRETADQPPDIWAAPLTNMKAARRLTDFNPELESLPLGKAKLLSYRDALGTDLQAAVLLPPGWAPGRRVPLIVYPYGSEYRSFAINVFGFLAEPASWINNMQLFVTRGFAVLFPDAPVHAGTPMTDVNRTVLAGVDAAVSAGIADASRIGVMGLSNGGFSVLALVTQSDRFSAAISDSGFSDWATVYSEFTPDGSAHGISFAEEFDLGLGADPWSARDRYIENSPFWQLDRVKTPVLIVHGTNDTSVDNYNGAMTFVALRRLGKDTQYVSYAGEDHGPSSGWKYANQLDYMQRALAWFDRFLCPRRISAVSCGE